MARRNTEADEVGADSAPSDEPIDLTNKSVIKATSLLRELGRHPQGITVTQIAQAVGMTRPTAFRMLLTLEQTGFVDRQDNRYRLGWRMALLGKLADPYAGAAARVQPILDEYATKFNETVSFAMRRDETSYDVIAEASASRLLNASALYVWGSYPVHASATGKLLLAELSDDRIIELLPRELEGFTANTITRRSDLIEAVRQVREQGYAILDDELEQGLFAAAHPVRDEDGTLVGALIVQGPTERLKGDRLPETIATLRTAADEVAKALA